MKEETTMTNCKVNNVPQYAHNYRYWVVRAVEGELWFWGAWNDENRANEVAAELLNGAIVVNM